MEINILSDIYEDDWQIEAIKWSLKESSGQPVVVNISSNGGSVMQAIKIVGLLAAHDAATTAKIHGVCASAATLIALACDKVIMSKQGFFMIHNALLWGWGNKEDFEKDKALLDKVDSLLLDAYKEKILKSEKWAGSEEELADQLKEMMVAETWLTSQEALEIGLVDMLEEREEKNFISNLGRAYAMASAPNTKKKMGKEKKSLLEKLKAWVNAEEKEAAGEVAADPVENPAEAGGQEWQQQLAQMQQQMQQMQQQLAEAQKENAELQQEVQAKAKALDNTAPFAGNAKEGKRVVNKERAAAWQAIADSVHNRK